MHSTLRLFLRKKHIGFYLMHKNDHGFDSKKHLKYLKQLKRDLKRHPKLKVPKHPFAKYGYKYPTFEG